jgi:thiol-disulfide isomerase/thioredoxin
MLKKAIVFFWVFFSFLNVNIAQTPTEQLTARFQSYIKENVYQKVAAPLYDDELVEVEDYLLLTQEVKMEMKEILNDGGGQLNPNELKTFELLINEVYVQLAELYLERMADLSLEDKLNFIHRYYIASGFFSEIEELNENLSKLIIKTYLDVFEEPYFLAPSDNVIQHFTTLDSSAQQVLDAASILHGVGFLSMDIDQLEGMVKNFQLKFKDSPFQPALEKSIASAQQLKKGSLVEDFEFVKLDGTKVRLSDFKDKIIYLDLWATWCGPCIQTFKTKTPKFEQQLNDYPEIELMYVSIDEKKESWEKYLDKNPMKGTHAYLGQGFNSKIMEYFKVFGIPRYLIIGKGNQLLDPNAPRPGEEAFELLVQYINQ